MYISMKWLIIHTLIGAGSCVVAHHTDKNAVWFGLGVSVLLTLSYPHYIPISLIEFAMGYFGVKLIKDGMK